MDNEQLCKEWDKEFERTTGKSDRRMTYRDGWFRIQKYVEGIEGQAGTGWQPEWGSNYRKFRVEEMVKTLKGRPNA